MVKKLGAIKFYDIAKSDNTGQKLEFGKQQNIHNPWHQETSRQCRHQETISVNKILQTRASSPWSWRRFNDGYDTKTIPCTRKCPTPAWEVLPASQTPTSEARGKCERRCMHVTRSQTGGRPVATLRLQLHQPLKPTEQNCQKPCSVHAPCNFTKGVVLRKSLPLQNNKNKIHSLPVTSLRALFPVRGRTLITIIPSSFLWLYWLEQYYATQQSHFF